MIKHTSDHSLFSFLKEDLPLHIPHPLKEILKKDYYILPSSVHEVIIVPYSEIYVCSKLDEMVREINSTQVEEEDVLSNHVYLYDRVSGKLRVGSSVQTGRMMA